MTIENRLPAKEFESEAYFIKQKASVISLFPIHDL